MRINRSYFLQASSWRDALIGGENERLKRSTFSQPRPLHILGPQDVRLLFRELWNEACLFLQAIFFFQLTWVWFTFGSIFYQRSISFRELPHVTALFSTSYLQGKFGGVPGIECIRSLASRHSRIYHFALSKFHQSDLYFSDLEIKHLLSAKCLVQMLMLGECTKHMISFHFTV